MEKIIQKCSKPVRILDRVKGGYMFVACGHCPACVANYKSLWKQRLECEAQSSATTLFFTLTYDNNNIPSLTYNERTNTLLSNRHEKDDIILDDYKFDSLQLNYLPNIQNDETTTYPRIGYCSKIDIQNFLKRLRRMLDYDSQTLVSDVEKTDRQFRYFVAAEYGPNTFRPHYHGLLFFSNKRVAEAVKECYFYKSWTLCNRQNMDISTVVSNASSYVAKYVRCDTKLPDILTIAGKTKTFYLSSRRPAIGVNYFDYSGLVDKVEHHSAHVDKLSYAKNSVSVYSLPVLRPAASYFFSKIYKSHTYDIGHLLSFYTDANKFITSKHRQQIAQFETFAHARSYISSIIPNHIREVDSMLEYFKRKHIDIKSLSDIYHLLSKMDIMYGISQNRSCILKCIYYTTKYNISHYEYIRNYLNFYTVKNSETLNYMYECYNDMLERGYSKLDVARFVYPSFFETLPSHFDSMSDDQKINYEMVIASLDILHSDIYNQSGFLCILCRDINKDYVNTSMYQSFDDHVKDKNIQFEKTRLKNHMLNQKLGNYERF